MQLDQLAARPRSGVDCNDSHKNWTDFRGPVTGNYAGWVQGTLDRGIATRNPGEIAEALGGAAAGGLAVGLATVGAVAGGVWAAGAVGSIDIAGTAFMTCVKLCGAAAALGMGFLAATNGDSAAIGGGGAAADLPTFADQALRDAHYAKHVVDQGEFAGFGYGSAADYEAGAQRFLTGGQSMNFTRANGDVVHYLADTNEFGVLSSAGDIRTYFQPEEGINYFIREFLR